MRLIDFSSYKVQLFFLAIVSFGIYAQTIYFDYAWDDALVITKNQYTTQGLDGLKDIWTKEGYLANRSVYRPIPQTIFALQWEFFPDNPTAVHFTNCLLYVFCCWSVLFFLQLLFPKIDTKLFFLVALLFALHPVHVEVVANGKSTDELCAFLFGMLSLSFFIKSLTKPTFYFLTLLLFIAAMLSKVSAITLLPIFLIVWYYKTDNFFLEIKDFFKNQFERYKKLFLGSFQTYQFDKYLSSILFLALVVLGYSFYSANFYIASIAFFIFLFLQYRWKSDIAFLIIASTNFTLFLVFEANFLCILYMIILVRHNFKSRMLTTILILLFGILLAIFSLDGGMAIIVIAASILAYLIFLKKEKLFSKYIIFFTALICLFIFFEDKYISGYGLTLLLWLAIWMFFESKFSILLKWKLLILFVVAISFQAFFVGENFGAFKLSEFFKSNHSIQVVPKQIEQSFAGMTTIHNVLYGLENVSQKFATICSIQLKYLQLLVFPHPLVHQYGFSQIEIINLSNWKVWASILAHLSLFIYVILNLKRKSRITFGILFYLVTISIYTNIFRLMPDSMAERFLFTPSLGLCLAIVFVFYKIFNHFKLNLKLFYGLFIIVFILYGFKVVDRSKAWKNNYELAARTIPYAENNAAINAQYANELLSKTINNPTQFPPSKFNKTIEKHLKKSVEIVPDFYGGNADLGAFYISAGEPSNAEPYLKKAIEIRPSSWINHYYLGFVYYEKKNFEKASKYLLNALEYGYDKMVDSEKKNAIEFLARCYFNLKQLSKASVLLQKEYSVKKDKSLLVLLANIYRQAGDIENAINTFQQLKKDYPNDEEIDGAIQILNQLKDTE